MSIHRVPTGIPKLDELIEGGFPSDSMILLVGYPGAGKTIFSGQFIHIGAAKHGARGVYACFCETKETFIRNMLRFGWDFERLERDKRIAILDLAVTREAGLQTNLNTIMESMTSLNASRLVIDSFSAINMALKEAIDIRVMIHLLYKFLKKANCVSILVQDQPWGSTQIGQGICEFIADGIIHLETYFDKENRFRRRLRILKMRGTNHTKVPHEYDITDEGFIMLEGQSVEASPSDVKARKSRREPYFPFEEKEKTVDF
ncbi:MAG: RAD55 family ATPase [Candidatus Bathyarchaeia archaeon]